MNLIGRLTRDPEVKFTPSGTAVAHFSIAVDRAGDKGDDGYESGFFDCEAWDKSAELIEQWFHKGKQIGVTGRLRHHRWEKDGQKRSKVEVVVSQITFVGNKDDGDGERQYEDRDTGQQAMTRTPTSGGGGSDFSADDDIPFAPTVC